MNALNQALRALDPHEFELLIFDLMRERYPHGDIKHVEGSAGDQGLDIISGQLDDRPTVWQCKSFSTGIKDSQKRQIKDSLHQALQHHTPHRWVLCLNIDMDAKALRWFQRLTNSRAKDTRIDLMQASDIVHQLLYRNTVREQFFPATVLDTAMIRESLAGTREFSAEELNELNERNVQIFLARLEGRDSRFAYAITYNRNQEPTSNPVPGALMTMTRGDTIVTVFPRDHAALRDQPPQATFTVRGAGVDKFMDHLHTGAPQTLLPGEIEGFTSDFDFLRPKDEVPGLTLKLGVKTSAEVLPMRVTFGAGDGAVVYEYVPFKCIQGGTKQAVYESTSKLPFRMQVTFDLEGSGRVDFQAAMSGNDVHDVLKFLRALTSAAAGDIELYDLNQSTRVARARVAGTLPEWIIPYTSFIADAVNVADTYGVTLVLPAVVTAKDASALYLLKRLPEGIPVPTEEVTITLTKAAEVPASIKEGLGEENAFRVIRPTLFTSLAVFGTTITPGPIQYDLRAHIKDPGAFLTFLDSAPPGADATIILIPTQTIARLLEQAP